jgi:hypothetical protein
MIGIILNSAACSVFMDETEVTNLYLEYLDWLKAFFHQKKTIINIYEGASPDTLVWEK